MLIDWFTVIAQIVNFLILIWLMNRFLFKPVQKAIDRREKSMADALSRAKQAEKQARARALELEEEQRAFENARQRLMADAQGQVAQWREKTIATIQEEVETLRQMFIANMNRDRQAFLERVKQQMVRQVMRIGEKVLRTGQRRMVLCDAPPIMDRDPVAKPLQTGLKVVDALFPIGRGQRELILGDRQTGKTAVALDTIVNQKHMDVICIYCAIGQRSAGIAKVVGILDREGAMGYSVVVVVEGDAPPGLQYIAPYAATTLNEYFMEQGRDVFVVYDDLTRHAVAYRQLSLLLRRPPGREAFPGDIFYVHSRLLERSTHLRQALGDGSLTALPIAETEAQNIAAYIPTNLISITDGQIYLSQDLFQKGALPAVDVGKSVSRVGGKAQLPAYGRVAGDLRLSYTQFQELESFARFGTRLDERTKQIIGHGRRVREVLKQKELSTMSTGEQISVLFAVVQGLMDDIPEEKITQAETMILDAAKNEIADLDNALSRAANDDPLWNRLTGLITTAISPLKEDHADTGISEPQDQDRP